MKNKKIQIPIILIACIIALAGVYKLLDSVCYPLVEAKAEQYLCDKYDAKPEEFELVDYNQAHLFWEEYEIFFQKPVWIDFSFEYVYKDRHFVVSRNKNGFYDDYQFDDIQKWCTEWLQENVDERIVGVYFNTYNILNYYENMNKKYDYILSRNDAKDFLINYKRDDGLPIFFFYDPKGPGYYRVDDKLAEEIRATLGLNHECHAEYTEKSVTKKIDRFVGGNWDTWTELK